MSRIYTDSGNIANIADAIREKTGKQGQIKLSEFPDEILSISGGGEPDDPYVFPTYNYNRNLQIISSLKKDDKIRTRILDSTINPDIDNFILDFSPIQYRYGRYFDLVSEDNTISGRIGYGGVDGNCFLPGVNFGKKLDSYWVTSIGGNALYFNEKFNELKDDLSLPYEIEGADYGWIQPSQTEWGYSFQLVSNDKFLEVNKYLKKELIIKYDYAYWVGPEQRAQHQAEIDRYHEIIANFIQFEIME